MTSGNELPSGALLAEVQEELRKVTNAHIADRVLLAQLTTLCREISDWLWDGPMTDLDKRIIFADRLKATLKQANNSGQIPPASGGNLDRLVGGS